MNSKIIRIGNAFYETDDECMEKKARASSESVPPAPGKKNNNINKNGLFSYKSSRK